jgi:hypothetical protein
MDIAVATGTLLLAAGTAVLAFFTWRSVQVSQRALRADLIPLLVPTRALDTTIVSGPPPHYGTALRNVGRGSAFDVDIRATFQNYEFVARAGVVGPGQEEIVHFAVQSDVRQYPQTRVEDFDGALSVVCHDALGRTFQTRANWAYQRSEGPRRYWYGVRVSGPDLPRARKGLLDEKLRVSTRRSETENDP